MREYVQEKIQALLDRAQFMPSALSDISFEVRYDACQWLDIDEARTDDDQHA